MHLKDHEKACIEEFGKPYTEVHFGLDRFFEKFNWQHRLILHHRLGVDLLAKQIGEEVRDPAEQHIRLDLDGLYPEDWSFYVLGIVIDPRVWAIQQKALRKLYGPKTFDAVQSRILSGRFPHV